MISFIVRRVLVSVPVLIGSSIVVFTMAKFAGDPLEDLKLRNPPVPRRTIELESHRLGLDRSSPEQYWNWIKGLVLHGDFGQSVQPSRSIRPELGDHLLVTARLVAASVIIALVLALISGVLSAVKQYSVIDYSTTFMSFLFLSMPVFWFAVLLKTAAIWYNQHIAVGKFYTIGERSPFLPDRSALTYFTDAAGHLVLPAVALGLGGYASWSRFTRASMLEVLNSDYVRLARSKGLRPRQVLTRHALRTALIPLTTVTALDIATLMGGAIVTETVFQWHGMGVLFIDALREDDTYLLLGWLMIAATIVILFNLVADILYGVLDPRIRRA